MWNYIKSAPPLNIAICTTAVINFTVGLCFAKFLNFLRIGKIRDYEEQILRNAREEGQQLRERIQSDRDSHRTGSKPRVGSSKIV